MIATRRCQTQLPLSGHALDTPTGPGHPGRSDAGLLPPLDPGEVIPGKGHFLRHGHVIIGDIALRGFKDKGRWKYDDRDVRRAGQALAAVDVDHHDLIEIQVPRPLLAGETDAAESWNRADWRRTLSSWMHSAALQKELDEGRDWSGLAEIGENGLPGRLHHGRVHRPIRQPLRQPAPGRWIFYPGPELTGSSRVPTRTSWTVRTRWI